MIRNHSKKTCVVCRQPLLFHSFRDTDPVCLRAECKQVLAKKSQMSKSSYELFFKLRSEQAMQTVEYETVTRKKIEEKKKREKKENLACWKSVIKDKPGLDFQLHPFTVIPSNTQTLGQLSENRKEVYQTHIVELIREVVTGATSSDVSEEQASSNDMAIVPTPSQPFESVLQVKACSFCKGGCCSVGGDHAFLKPETISAYMERHPDASEDQVLNAYLSFLPEQSFVESCVNHTESGCSLPRSMRSHICNRYLCGGLVKISEMFEQEPFPEGVLFIRRAQNLWNKDDVNLDNAIVGHELVIDPD